MPVTITATPGDAAANSYETLTEFQTYLGLRLHVPATVTALLLSDPTEILPKALIMATRGLDRILTAYRRLTVLQTRSGMTRFYLTNPHWTGVIASTTQALAWPRSGMYDRNGNAIGTTTIPQELKDAESEMAILAVTTDLTADNAIVTQGITDVVAGPVEVQFKEFIQKQLLPDAVAVSLVPSWLTDELFENVPLGQFRTVGTFGRGCNGIR
jgi:hypothetical protein